MGSVGTGAGNYLRFEKLPLEKGQKLHKYNVINHTLYDKIGVIHWRGGWMQYVFTAFPDIDMSRGCHKQIDGFIDKLMEEWRNARRKTKKKK